MKKFILINCLCLFAIAGYSQEKENGTIYINHPYIDVVNKTNKAYLEKDMATLKTLYADTAKWWASGMEKPVPMADAYKIWLNDFDHYDSIRIVTVGYPDYLHYTDKDQKWVQSWGTWVGKSKKTGEALKIDFVQFNKFNSAGKIESEGLYGDFSKMEK